MFLVTVVKLSNPKVWYKNLVGLSIECEYRDHDGDFIPSGRMGEAGKFFFKGDCRMPLVSKSRKHKTTYNSASLPCLCLSCSRVFAFGGTCSPNTNSFVTACGGYTKSQQAVA